jgi:hypothetical protein
VSNEERKKQLAETGFSEIDEYPESQTLSDEEILRMKKSSNVNLQSHTRFHPILTKCTDEDANDEISLSKKYLEKSTA